MWKTTIGTCHGTNFLQNYTNTDRQKEQEGS